MRNGLADGEGVVGATRPALGGVIWTRAETMGRGTAVENGDLARAVGGGLPRTKNEAGRIPGGGEALGMLDGVPRIPGVLSLAPALQRRIAVKLK